MFCLLWIKLPWLQYNQEVQKKQKMDQRKPTHGHGKNNDQRKGGSLTTRKEFHFSSYWG